MAANDKLIFRAGVPEVGDYVATGFSGLALGSFAVAATGTKQPVRMLAGAVAISLVLQAIVGVPERKR